MNWLLVKLSNDKTYFPIFMGVLSLYAIGGCFLTNWMVDNHPEWTAKVIFLLFFGGIGLAYGSRVVHNFAYAIVNGSHED